MVERGSNPVSLLKAYIQKAQENQAQQKQFREEKEENVILKCILYFFLWPFTLWFGVVVILSSILAPTPDTKENLIHGAVLIVLAIASACLWIGLLYWGFAKGV